MSHFNGSLTPQQRALVERSPSSRMVVLAPAGTGKTEVVAHRLIYLVEECGLQPGAEALVLSFSRNAVAELRKRIRSRSPRVAAAQVATFDSFATRILARHGNPGEWESDGYEARIRGAAALISDHPEAREDIGTCLHLIVDEVQDLVGDRAELVDTIMQALRPEAGFTVLGDPAQGIYDFQLDGSESKVTSRQFLRRVLDGAPEPAVELLTDFFRAQSDGLKDIARQGDALRTHVVSGNTVDNHAGDTVLVSLFGLHTYDTRFTAKILEDVAEGDETGAVLCRFNSQALVLSRAFHEAGLAHILQPAADTHAAAPWLAAVLRGCETPTMSRAAFDQRLTAAGIAASLDPEVAWRGLLRAQGLGSPDLSLRYLASGLRTRRVPEELVQTETSKVVVSSVHRAKGLEWDVVFVCGLDTLGDDTFESARLAYVAMTRAREDLFGTAGPDTRGLKMNDQPDGRWVRSDFGTKRATQIEMLTSDVESMVPGGRGFVDADAGAVQEYLLTEVQSGDEVELVLVKSYEGGRPRAIYRIDHRGQLIGETSTYFSEALRFNIKRQGGGPFPAHISGVRTHAVESVAGSTAAGMRAGLGASGIWLRPRLSGLGDLNWETARD